MRKLFVSLLSLGLGASVALAGEPFTLEYNFDSNADFPAGTIVAPGWSFEGGVFQRGKAADYGVTAHSGDYVLGKAVVTFNETIFTPMMTLAAGEPCTFEFELMAPGGTPATVRNIGFTIKAGTAQSSSAHTIEVGTVENKQYADWTHFSFTFTPEEEGDYCFSFKAFNPNFSSNCGGAYFDDVVIRGQHPGQGGFTEPDFLGLDDLEPNEENVQDCQELPYIENFTNPEHYDGSSYLPVGWHSTGSMTWRTANLQALPAADGEYYMIAYHSEVERDENAYTPMFNLAAGVTYALSFMEYMQGNDYNADGILTTPTLYVTVGTEQDADFHAKLLSTSERTSAGWTERTVEFTPAVSGPYCFAFMLRGAANSGIVAVDKLIITADGLVAVPEPAFGTGGLFDLMDSKLTVTPGSKVKFWNASKYATDYEWYCAGAEPESSTDENPEFTFPTSADYTVALSASNERGTRTTRHTYTVKVATPGTFMVLHPHCEGADKIYDRGAVPTFATDADDYVSGFNHYYRTVAQRFDLGEGTPVSVSQLSCWVTDRRFRGTVEGVLDDQTKQPLTIRFYGSKADGSIDPDNVMGEHTLPLGEALGGFGLGSIGAENRVVSFPQPIELRGTVYVAMEFSEGMTVDPEDENLGRSFISTAVVRHSHGHTGMYALPYSVPEGVDATVGEWCPVDKFDPAMSGLSAYWHLWMTAANSITAVPVTPSGTYGQLFDLQGRPVNNLVRGNVYIIVSPEGTSKVIF